MRLLRRCWCGILNVLAANAQTELRIAGSSTVYPVARAWSELAELQAAYNLTLEGGGSSSGAMRVCTDSPQRVDIGCMSRQWKSKEALLLDDGYTYECVSTKKRVTQLQVGIDGIAVVVSKNSAGHDCLTSSEMGGLTAAQLRWMFSTWTNRQLADAGLDMASVVPNDDGDTVKEWSDLGSHCPEVPINVYGPGEQSGTFEFFQEAVLCDSDNCPEPEHFSFCDPNVTADLEHASPEQLESAVRQRQRPLNCYMASETDETILTWTLADPGGVAFFGFAYYVQNAARLTVVRIADDKKMGVADTQDAKVEPSPYSIVDGSYDLFRRALYMNVDNARWDRSYSYLAAGFSQAGQRMVRETGYVAINANLAKKMWQRIQQQGNHEADYVPLRPSICWNGSELIEEPYQNQWGNPKIRYLCMPCVPGSFKLLNTPSRCVPCPAGSAAPRLGQSLCQVCRPGEFSSEGASNCTACDRNSAAGSAGAASCDTCKAGYFTKAPGSSECTLCEQGKFRREEDEDCIECGGPLTTRVIPAVGPGDCVCKEGLYRNSDGVCEQCPGGMSCAVGSDVANWNSTRAHPVLKPGFYATHAEPLSAFQCLRYDVCPGGEPESCNGGPGTGQTRLQGLVCHHCPQGQQLKGQQCEDCTPNGRVLLLGVVILGMVSIIVAHVMANWPLTRGSRTVMTAVFFCGMAVTIVLTLGVYGTLDVIWESPLSEFLVLFSILRLDLENFSFSCFVGRKDFVVEQSVKMVGFPLACAAAAAGSFLLSKIPKTRRFSSFNAPALINTAGFLLSALLVSVSFMSMDGFRCKQNPNGRQILRADGHIVCWEGGVHTDLLVLSSLAILVYPTSFLALTAYAAFNFAPLSVRYGVRFTASVRFLSGRMQPDRILFGLAWNVRNFLISLVPVVAANDFAMQILLILVIFLLWLVVQSTYQCWRFGILNMLDTVVSVSQVIMLWLFTLFADIPNKDMVGWSIITMFVAVVMLLVTSAMLKIVLFLRGRKHYDIFISHHKAAAALAARHLKTLLGMCSTSFNVFLDVDELDNLDYLTFAVKSTRKLLVLLTSDVLTRPWCALEITTAFLNQVQIGIVDLTVEQVDLRDTSYLKQVLKSFTEEDLGLFAKHGITTKDVANAFFYLHKTSRTKLRLDLCDAQVQMDCVLQAAGQEMVRQIRRPRMPSMDADKTLYIVFNTQCEKQCSVAFLLRHSFREWHWDASMFCPASIRRSRQGPGSPGAELMDFLPLKQRSVAIVLMSRGLPYDAVAVGGLVLLQRAGVGIITVLSQETFSRPGQDYYQRLLANQVFQGEDADVLDHLCAGCTGSELLRTLKPLYKLLAWIVSPEQHISLFHQEMRVVRQRVEKEFMRRSLKLEAQGQRTSSCYPSEYRSPSSDLDMLVGSNAESAKLEGLPEMEIAHTLSMRSQSAMDRLSSEEVRAAEIHRSFSLLEMSREEVSFHLQSSWNGNREIFFAV